MICEPCKNSYHEGCPSHAAEDPKKPPTGLSVENNIIQRSGLCGCQHRASVVIAEAPGLAEAIHETNIRLVAAGLASAAAEVS